MDRDQSEDPTRTVGLDYRGIFEFAADGILVVDRDGTILDANEEACRQFGYELDELVGSSIDRLVPERLRGGHARHREAYHEQPRTRPMGIGLELQGRRRDGSEIPVEISLGVQTSGDRSYTVAVVRDMTERIQLRTLGNEAIKGAERERRRIAQELHDDTAQRLSALIVRLKLLVEEGDPESRAKAGEEIREQLREVTEGVRRIARGLRPPALEDAGVIAALRGHAQNFLDRADLTWELHTEAVDHLLGEDQKLVLYRVVQEAMTNVLRHADASHLEVSVHVNGSSVVATIADDGKGYEVSAPPNGPGLGLLGMRERAAGIGGEIACRSAPGKGTTITLKLPLEDPESLDG